MTNIEMQQVLINHGLLDPPADGLWGAQSQAALEDFQSLHKLPVTGQLDEATYSLLKEAPVSQINLGADIASKIISFMLKQNYFKVSLP
jgi:peptidoglycan hydrolase-like protein with peptidoglycan-binding domain